MHYQISIKHCYKPFFIRLASANRRSESCFSLDMTTIPVENYANRGAIPSLFTQLLLIVSRNKRNCKAQRAPEKLVPCGEQESLLLYTFIALFHLE